MNPIQSPSQLPLNFPQLPGGSVPASAPAGINFQDLLTSAISDVNNGQQSAQLAIQEGLKGNDVTNAEIFTAVKKADMAMRTMVQIRNKLVDAYNEVQNLRM